jgi:hypothetical protein
MYPEKHSWYDEINLFNMEGLPVVQLGAVSCGQNFGRVLQC